MRQSMSVAAPVIIMLAMGDLSAGQEKQSPRKKSVADLKAPARYEISEAKISKDEWDAFFGNGAPGAFVEYKEGTEIRRAEMADWTDGGVIVVVKSRFIDGRKHPRPDSKYAAKYVATTEPVELKFFRHPARTLFVIGTTKPEIKRHKETRTFHIGDVDVVADEKIEIHFQKGKTDSFHWMSKEVPFGGLVRWENADGSVRQEVVAYGKGKRE
jgi:hypothetical protein